MARLCMGNRPFGLTRAIHNRSVAGWATCATTSHASSTASCSARPLRLPPVTVFAPFSLAAVQIAQDAVQLALRNKRADLRVRGETVAYDR